ncbi:MAG: SDR family NAD(P)-dependent oxidoreductase [Saprospiraceae bacterium]
MNRIILAYSGTNAPQAQQIDNQLSRIGIPFEHQSSADGNFSTSITNAGEPVLLLVSDNFLKERNSMEGLLDCLSQFPANRPLVPVLVDGIDEDGKVVKTELDRMVNLLHYMNHWQTAWLDLSEVYKNAEPARKEKLQQELDVIRTIANQTGDIIAAIRNRKMISFEDFQANDFYRFFDRFELISWHDQYKNLDKQSQAPELPKPEPKPELPETPVTGGVFAPEPLSEPKFKEEEPIIPQNQDEPEPEEEPALRETEDTASQSLNYIEQAINDAQIWIERGYTERGVELLKIAAEEYPDSQELNDAYQKALSALPPEEQAELHPMAVEIEPTEIEVDSDTNTETPEIVEPEIEPEQQIKSYEMMGDLALDKGDYLFAKYCWDRVLELAPNSTGVYRKLGLMTAEHLHDYRETAIHYLNKALLENADDAEVNNCLQSLMAEIKEETPAPKAESIKEDTKPESPEQPKKQAAPKKTTAPKKEAKGTVLITGATSGIGKATAELFAQNGYRLILTGRRKERLKELKAHFESEYGNDNMILSFDVRNQKAVDKALSKLPKEFSEVDILINNAGLAKGLDPIHKGSLEHWETMIDTNVKGLLYVTRCISPGMVERKSGHIINLGSSAGKEAYPNGNVYCATKFAVDALTKAIRMDLHSYNIRVSQVSPGHVEETEFAINRFDGDKKRAKIYEDFQPLKSSDVADVIYFMATRPAHVNIQDVQMFGTQQASSMIIDRSGRKS